ncbi:adenylosuccinate lyase [Halobacteriaceae bacterium SHR40]|uniref:adenylosuccinate lyase n=1 Tax=Halovenus amylolytica TaxID=2500550 RepID=UPI000FE2C414
MTDRGPLTAVSPLDGRYARYTEVLVPYASEQALMRARVEVEIEYLIALAGLDEVPLSLTDDQRDSLREVYDSFDRSDAEMIKQLETEGYGEYSATNHDVKAVEYFIRENLPAGVEGTQWIHFGLTSEDANNLAYRLLVQGATQEVLLPSLRNLRDQLTDLAQQYRDVPMLARTHGQPATPTTFGKEMAVYASRLGRQIARIEQVDLEGKLAGASGTYAAHHAAYPDTDWPAFARSFVAGLGLEQAPLTTQVNPCDDLATLFDALRGANNVLLDLDVDAWLYISDRYLGQEAVEGETGSSTMPHKVNPIDFENSEGNLSKANSDLVFLGDYVTSSRLQRDLSDSTVKRNIGASFAHCLIGYEKLQKGLEKVTPNEQVMRGELEATPEIIGEAVQTILRREGHTDAYERVKELTRGQRVELADFHELFGELDVPAKVREELQALTPAGYSGLADELVDDLA